MFEALYLQCKIANSSGTVLQLPVVVLHLVLFFHLICRFVDVKNLANFF